jgi:hypothetical protein
MAEKEMVRITLEPTGLSVKVIVESEKRPGEMVRNLEIVTKAFELVDKRDVSDGVSTG